jgi:hypothetical protein
MCKSLRSACSILASNRPTGFIILDEKEKKKMLDMFQGDNPEEAEDMFLSCVLYGNYATVKSMESLKGINTARGFQLQVDGVKGDKVLLDGGTELTINAGFRGYMRRARSGEVVQHAVWNAKGPIKISNVRNERTVFEKRSSAPGAKKIGSAETYDMTDDIKKHIEALRENSDVGLHNFCNKIGAWLKHAPEDEKYSFKLICTKIPTIDYFLVFASGLFTFDLVEAEASCGTIYEECCAPMDSNDVVHLEDDEEYVQNKSDVKSALEKAYKLLVEKSIFDNSVFRHGDGASKLFNIHAFIFYAKSVLESETYKEDRLLVFETNILNFVNSGESSISSKNALNPTRFGCDKKDISDCCVKFIEEVGLRAPLIGNAKITAIKGAGEHIVSDRFMSELKAYKMAYGRLPDI